MCYGNWGNWGIGGSWVGGLIGLAFMLLVMGGVAAVIVYAVRSFARGSYPAPAIGPNADRALAALRERYARGEIDHDEYEERERRLMNNPRTGSGSV